MITAGITLAAICIGGSVLILAWAWWSCRQEAKEYNAERGYRPFRQPCQNPGCANVIVDKSEETCRACGHNIEDSP